MSATISPLGHLAVLVIIVDHRCHKGGYRAIVFFFPLLKARILSSGTIKESPQDEVLRL